jgi:hypothetical protein
LSAPSNLAEHVTNLEVMMADHMNSLATSPRCKTLSFDRWGEPW